MCLCTKKWIGAFAFMLMGLSFNVVADTSNHQFGLEVFHYRYEEPWLNVKISGPMTGLNWTGDHHFDTTLIQLRAEALLATSFGDSLAYDSRSTGNASTSSQMVELRGLLAYPIHADWDLMGGLGYRFLLNDGEGLVSSTGHTGYKRESNYTYLPVGIQYHHGFGDWGLKVSAEYDWLIAGEQNSYMAGGELKVENQQDKGYGARFALEANKRWDDWDVAVGPFVRYWNIADSNNYIVYTPTQVITFIEPHNTTVSTGLQVKFRFF